MSPASAAAGAALLIAVCALLADRRRLLARLAARERDLEDMRRLYAGAEAARRRLARKTRDL